ncbi:M48 family metalloprotease [bacterium]|nr:M48 family metalloprotease [bacterium]
MKCPLCKDSELQKVMTRQGVVVDYCPRCKGIWLEKGEIFLFAQDSKLIQQEIEEGLKVRTLSQYNCPETNESMFSIPLLHNTVVAGYCPKSQGIWLDGSELEKLAVSPQKGFSLIIEKSGLERINEEERAGKTEGRFIRDTALLALPNLVVRSSTVLIGLYGLLVLVLISLVQFAGLSPNFALVIGLVVAAIQFLLGPFIMDLSLRWLYKMDWVDPAGLPAGLRDFIEDICRRNGMKLPRMGIIHDGAPNAFTYGHHPNNARIVITQGILDLLNEKESQAVVAHEIGHAKHWDMLIMTVAQLVPLILFYIYNTLIRMRSKRDDDSGGYRVAVAIGAYILYIVSEYLVLWLSRTREYYADRFAGEMMENPNHLASALVKIGYGLAGQKPQKETEKSRQRSTSLEAVGALGIFDAHAARSLAITGYNRSGSMGGEVNKENLKGAMRWDLWNPWAKYYELHSTHPLIANRLLYLSNQAAYAGIAPYVSFNEAKPESYWDEFFTDLFIKFAPLLSLLIFGGIYLVNPGMPLLGLCLAMTGLSFLFQTLFSYKQSPFPDLSVANLLKKVKVSSVRPVPCTLKGRVIGRGVPGLIWSEDFVLQDETGIIFLDYKQPLRIWEFLFAIFRRESLQNQEVTVTGWYRRAPIPYIELKTLEAPGGRRRTCYVYHMKLAFAVALTAIGLFLILAA